MAIDEKAEILIEKTPEEVAEVMFNPKKDKIWIGGLTGVFPMESGLYRKGAKIERVGTFFNKHFNCKLLVTKYEENKMVQLYGDEPFEMNTRYDLKETDEGTIAKINISSISEILFDTSISVLSKAVLEGIESDLKRLKKHLENE